MECKARTNDDITSIVFAGRLGGKCVGQIAEFAESAHIEVPLHSSLLGVLMVVISTALWTDEFATLEILNQRMVGANDSDEHYGILLQVEEVVVLLERGLEVHAVETEVCSHGSREERCLQE